jgi:hypothetical protein
MMDEQQPTADPAPGSFSFWAAVIKLGAPTITSIALVVVWVVMIFTSVAYPADFRYAYMGALVFLLGKGLLTYFKTNTPGK